MTQFVDFVALGWVEQNLREEMDAARKSLHRFQREPDELQHLRDAGRNVHSATSALRLCALEPAALLTEEMERVLDQLHTDAITGDKRKLAMTELVAAIEALPAYLASVRAEREVTTSSIAAVVNDLRLIGNRPCLPESLFFNPPLGQRTGISSAAEPVSEEQLKDYARKAADICHKYMQAATERDVEALKLLMAVGKGGESRLAGTVLEPYFRCYMAVIEFLLQAGTQLDEVILDLFKHTFTVLRGLATSGYAAVESVESEPYIKKMLYYIGGAPTPTELQKSLLQDYGIDDVEKYVTRNTARMIQEDDLLDALQQTLQQLVEAMVFLSSRKEKICASNETLVEKVVPSLLQISMQLHVIGLTKQAGLVNEQYKTLRHYAEKAEPAAPGDLVDFGGVLADVRDSLEYCLKHGLSATGDIAAQDLDNAISEQVARCLRDMKGSLNREFVRQEIQKLVGTVPENLQLSIAGLRPLYRGARMVAEPELYEAMEQWQDEGFPDYETVQAIAHGLLGQFKDDNFVAHASSELKQILSVLGMLPDKQRECAVLGQCALYIDRSAELGGLRNDASMTCFAEAVAALEQFMECRYEDPRGNADQHLARAESRAAKLAGLLSQRDSIGSAGKVVDFGAPHGDFRGNRQAVQSVSRADVVDLVPAKSAAAETENPNNIEAPVGTPNLATAAPGEEEALDTPNEQIPSEHATAAGDSVLWSDAMDAWAAMEIARPPADASEGPDAEIDEELRECFVEESHEYLSKLENTLPQFAADLDNKQLIQDIRVVFHTMKGSARTIGLLEFGDFMHDMEVVFNALRDGYIQATAELAEFVSGVAGQLPRYTALILQRTPLAAEDFLVPSQIAAAIGEKRFDSDFTLEMPALSDSSDPVQLDTAEVEEVTASDETPAIAYHEGIWGQYSAEDITDSVVVALAGTESAENEAMVALATRLVRSVLPALVELRDAGFMELASSNVACFLELSAIEHLASGAMYGLIEDQSGERSKVEISAGAKGVLLQYLEEASHNETSIHAHAQAESLLIATLSLSEPPAEEEESEPEAFAHDNILAFRDHSLQAAEAAESPVEDIDEELLELFIETLDEYTESIDASMVALSQGDETGLRGLKNTLHTVKGSANSIGLTRLGAMVHECESRIGELEHSGDIFSLQSVSAIDSLMVDFSAAAQFVRKHKTDWDESAVDIEAETWEDLSEALASTVIVDTSVAATELADEKRTDTLRVETSKVDRLLDMGVEIGMSNVRCRQALDAATQERNEVQGLARRVLALVDRLSLQLDTEIQAKTGTMTDGQQFDPLEMDRMTEKQGLAAILREAAYDLEEEAGELGTHLDGAIREAISSSRLMQASQSDLRMLRLVNFSKLGPGFRRLVHQVSRQLGKQVEFDFTCGEGGLDIGVFGQIKTALEHMLRNAIDHGIDTPDRRSAQGKAERGNVKLAIIRQGSEFVIRLLDDGSGMDPAVLRAKAKKMGILGENEDISDEEALRLVFRAGFSTAETVTDVSGRGVGMDVVYQSITQAGGSVSVQSKPGFYTQFDIRIPASIMVNEAVLATVGEEQIAVPLTSLSGSDFRRKDEVHREANASNGRITFRGDKYEVRYLGAVRGTQPLPSLEMMPDFVPVLFAQLNRRRVAFFADGLDNAEDMVIRSLGAQYTGVPGIAGGAVKSDGQPVLALDLNEFIGQVDHADKMAAVSDSMEEQATLVLCVDDSVMMRRTYEKRLESLGYKVVTAVDGEDALDYLSQAAQLPDFIFTDLEMPNMNGFEFIANLRRAPKMEHIPTVVVSSRDADKHRSEAQRVGANGFMAKGSNTADGMQAVIQEHLNPTALVS